MASSDLGVRDRDEGMSKDMSTIEADKGFFSLYSYTLNLLSPFKFKILLKFKNYNHTPTKRYFRLDFHKTF